MAEARGHALQVAGVETEDSSALIALRERLTATPRLYASSCSASTRERTGPSSGPRPKRSSATR